MTVKERLCLLTVHAHPTFAEALMEAAEVSLGRPIHVRPPKR